MKYLLILSIVILSFAGCARRSYLVACHERQGLRAIHVRIQRIEEAIEYAESEAQQFVDEYGSDPDEWSGNELAEFQLIYTSLCIYAHTHSELAERYNMLMARHGRRGLSTTMPEEIDPYKYCNLLDKM